MTLVPRSIGGPGLPARGTGSALQTKAATQSANAILVRINMNVWLQTFDAAVGNEPHQRDEQKK